MAGSKRDIYARKFFQAPFVKIFLIIFLFISSLFIFKVLFYDYYPDFSSYYYGTLSLVRGGNPYLVAEKAFGPFLYPPPSLILFIPLTYVSFSLAAKIFTLTSLISLFLSLVLLFKIIKVKPFSNLGMLLIILAFNFFPAKFTLGMGQINNVVLFLLVLFTYLYLNLKNRKPLAGIPLAMAVILKISPIIIVIYLIIKKDWKTFAITSLTLIIMGTITYFLIDRSIISYFFESTLPGLISAKPGDYYNQSLTGFLMREVENIHLQNQLRAIATTILATYSFYLIWVSNKTGADSPLLSLSILITLSLIISGVSWQHHFVLALIPLFLTFTYIKKQSLNIKYYFILIVSYLLIAFNLKNPNYYPVILQSHVFYGAMLLFFLEIYLLATAKSYFKVIF